MSAATALLRSNFGRAAASYDSAADFQREAGERLIRECPPDLSPLLVLDAGCGTGHGLQLMAQRWPRAEAIAIDFAVPMLGRLPLTPVTTRVCADIECLPLASNCVNLVWSSLVMQWCDGVRALAEFHRVAQPGAHLAVLTLGPRTFAELRRAFAGVDSFRHTNDFIEEANLRTALISAGFSILSLRRLGLVRHYADLRSLLASVRDLGASRVVADNKRRGLMGKSAWQRFADNYERMRTVQGLPLTYDTYFVLAKK